MTDAIMLSAVFDSGYPPTVSITPEMINPLFSDAVSIIGVILPAGLCVFGICVAIRLVPSILSSFLNR